MNVGAQVPVGPAPEPNVLGEMLHSLNQPLTTLRCILEISLDRAGQVRARDRARQDDEADFKDTVAAALHQTERVIDMVQLMRAYLDERERPGGITPRPENAKRSGS